MGYTIFHNLADDDKSSISKTLDSDNYWHCPSHMNSKGISLQSSKCIWKWRLIDLHHFDSNPSHTTTDIYSRIQTTSDDEINTFTPATQNFSSKALEFCRIE